MLMMVETEKFIEEAARRPETMLPDRGAAKRSGR
jgi:hypothetical protein